MGLDPSAEQLRAVLTAAVDYVVGFLDRLPRTALSATADTAATLADEAVRRPPPAEGRPFNELLEVLDRAAAPGLNTASPGYLAFVPGSGLVIAAVADLLAGVLNRYTGFAFAAPGLVALEADVLDWLAGLFGFPPRCRGLVTSGASMATLSAVITARSAMLPENFLAGTLYVIEHTHQSVAKAALLAGLPSAAVRVVPVDAQLHMDPEALRAAVAADRAAGRQPFLVAATAGTTNTGVVDPLPAIAEVARQERLWLHVDAAYGGFFQLTKRGRQRLRGIERADSLALDAHKGLFLPFGTGILLVRDGDLLRRAHTIGPAAYLQDIQDSDLPDFAAYGPELTRPFRGLRLWLALHLHGVEAFRAAMDDKLDLTAYAYRQLSADRRFDVPAEPELSTVAFRLRHGDTAELLRRVNAEQRTTAVQHHHPRPLHRTHLRAQPPHRQGSPRRRDRRPTPPRRRPQYQSRTVIHPSDPSPTPDRTARPLPLPGLVVVGPNLGVEFTGGRVLEYSVPAGADPERVRVAVAEAGFPRAVVQASGDTAISVRTEPVDQQTVERIRDAVATASGNATPVRDEQIGPSLGAELRTKALIALGLAVLAQLTYLAVRFDWRLGLATVVALAQDVLLVLGIFAWLGKIMDGVFMAALLTVIGYSVNDTVVVFDRVRELRAQTPREPFARIAGAAVLQTLPRTVNTGIGVLFVLGTLLVLGDGSLADFALALLLGLLVGTASTVATAAPVAILLDQRHPGAARIGRPRRHPTRTRTDTGAVV